MTTLNKFWPGVALGLAGLLAELLIDGSFATSPGALLHRLLFGCAAVALYKAGK